MNDLSEICAVVLAAGGGKRMRQEGINKVNLQ